MCRMKQTWQQNKSFFDPGDFLENRSMPDIETILRIHIKCEDMWPIIIRRFIH